MSEESAISVFDEAAKVYWDNFKNCSDFIRPQLSAAMIQEIFNKMVVPAIDKVRQIDRS